MARGRKTSPPATNEPLNATTGAPRLRKFMLKLFDREDGKAADWPMIAETLLAEAFYALDQTPNDPRIPALLRRANSGTYDRLAGNPSENGKPSDGKTYQAVDNFNMTAGRSPVATKMAENHGIS